jgi:hypothetical protein
MVDASRSFVLKSIWMDRTEMQEAITIKLIRYALRFWRHSTYYKTV